MSRLPVVRDGVACLRLLVRCARGPLLLQVVLALVAGALPVVAAVAARLLFDGIDRHESATRLSTLAVLVALSGVLLPCLSQLSGYLSAVVAGRVSIAVEDELFAAVSRSTGIGPFESPDYLSRLRLAEQSAQEAPQSIASFLLTLVQGGVAAVGLLVVVMTVWAPMAGLVGIGVLASVLAQRVLIRVEVDAAHTVSRTFRQRYLYQSVLTDARSVKEVRLFGLADFFRSRMMTAVRGAVDAQVQVHRRTAQVGASLSLLSGVVAGIGLVVVAVRAGRGQATVGDLTLFLAAAAGIQSAAQGIVREGGQARACAILFGAFRELTASGPDLPDGSGAPAPLQHTIRFHDVWFRYSADGPWVLRGLDLAIPAGESLALVGLNGAGKSSIVKLLCRLYDPEQGTITWDGKDLRTFAVADLRRRIGVTFQDFMPYDLTARENIGIGQVDRIGEDALVRDAARLAGADTVLERLPRSYDTMLSRSFDDAEELAGVTLSGGQWQRVALARSLARSDADLLVLDEPSSGLDAEAEADVHERLRRHRAGRTSLLISHRLSTVRDADAIAVLRDGRIAELGTHRELLALGGEYARLFELQSAGYRDEVPV